MSTKNRDRLLDADVAAKFMVAVLAHREVKPLLSSDHFSVDGTLVEACASLKSFRAKDGSDEPPRPGRNGERDFHGEKRPNDTHESTTDPDAKLYRKSSNTAAKLCFIGHSLAENQHGLIVQADETTAPSRAECEAAIAMIERHWPGSERRLMLVADKGYDTKGFVAACRRMCVKPNVVAKVRHSAVDGRTTRHASYAVSQRHASLSMVPSARKFMPFALKRSLAEVSNELIDRPQKVHRWHQIKQMPRIGVLRIAE